MARTRRELLKLGGGVVLAGAVAGCTDDGEAGDAEEEPADEGAAEDDPAEDDHEEDHDHDDDEDDHDDEHGHVEVEELDIVDHETGEEVAYIHGDHWHGGLQVPVGETVEFGAVFVDAEGEEIPLGEDEQYELNAEVAEGAQEGIVAIEPHGDHVDVTGEEEGLTEVVFMLWHDDHADYEAPPIETEVAAEFEDDHGHDDDHEEEEHGHDEEHDDHDDDDDHGHDHDDDDDH
ncbi:MAG: hypothetical protein QXG03_00660 [Halalkalicoccus sp.]